MKVRGFHALNREIRLNAITEKNFNPGMNAPVPLSC